MTTTNSKITSKSKTTLNLKTPTETRINYKRIGDSKKMNIILNGIRDTCKTNIGKLDRDQNCKCRYSSNGCIFGKHNYISFPFLWKYEISKRTNEIKGIIKLHSSSKKDLKYV